MKAIHKKLKILDEHSKGLFWFFASSLLLMLAMYVYLVNTAALNGVRWSQAEADITSLGASVSELESNYLSLKQSVTLATAYAKGFEDVRSVTFISTEKAAAVARAGGL